MNLFHCRYLSSCFFFHKCLWNKHFITMEVPIHLTNIWPKTILPKTILPKTIWPKTIWPKTIWPRAIWATDIYWLTFSWLICNTITHLMVLPIPSISCCVSQQLYFYEEEKALAFNQYRCCHLLQMNLFHYSNLSPCFFFHKCLK